VGYALGIDLGTTFTAAALVRDGRAEVVALGNHAATIPSMVFLRDDDNVLIGDAAERRGLQEPARLAREFKRRLGDSAPILLDRTPFSAERLMAVMLRQIVADVTQRQGSGPDRIAVSHPANWGQFKIDLLRQSVELAGLGNATFVTEPVAAAVQYASTERVEVGDVFAVYDLGGGTFDAAVLRKTADGFETLGRPQGIERLGGIDFDEAVFAHVRRTVGDVISQLDTSDAANRAALARLRQECVSAKETLSSDSDATVPVMLPNVQTQVRITRTEFEDMIRPNLRETIDSTRRAVESAGVQLADVKAVLLAGGSSRIPLVGEMVRSELGRPVVTDSHPKHAVALGAARIAQQAGASLAAPLAAPPTPVAAVAPPPATPPTPVAAAAPLPAAAPPRVPLAAPSAPVAASLPTSPIAAQAAGAGGPVASRANAQPVAKKERSQWVLLVGGIAAAALLVGGLAFAFSSGDDSEAGTATTEPAVTFSSAVTTVVPDTLAPVTTEPGTAITTATGGTTATTASSPTSAAGTSSQQTCGDEPFLCVGILEAEWGADGVLRVVYNTNGFVPDTAVDGENHVHFFWSSVAPDSAGAPGDGPWYVWDLAAGDGQYLFDGFNIDNLESYGYKWEDDLCITIATHQHELAGRLDANGNGTYYCMPNTPTPSAG